MKEIKIVEGEYTKEEDVLIKTIETKSVVSENVTSYGSLKEEKAGLETQISDYQLKIDNMNKRKAEIDSLVGAVDIQGALKK